MRIFTLIVLLAAISGCTWVKLTDPGKDVQIGYAGNVQNCQHLGVINASTQSRVLVERDEAKVQQELHTLARNNAATIGATNIILHGLPKDGVQAFAAYQCPRV